MASANPYRTIGDYVLIGDCHTAALIARDSSVDWFCPGRFDAPAVFCHLLDAQVGGYFRSAPTEAFAVERRYRGRTNVLENIFSTRAGSVRVTDLMPGYPRTAHRRGCDIGTSNRVLGLLEGLSGEVELELVFRPTFDYARAMTRLELEFRGSVARPTPRLLHASGPSASLGYSPHATLRCQLQSPEFSNLRIRQPACDQAYDGCLSDCQDGRTRPASHTRWLHRTHRS